VTQLLPGGSQSDESGALSRPYEACRGWAALPTVLHIRDLARMTDTQGYERFFAELKRRRVFRVMAVYGAVAFGIIEAADVILPRMALPDWTVTFVVWLALLGLPIVSVLAWALEMTPEGVQRTAEATPGELTQIMAAPASKRWAAGVLALIGVTALLGSAWYVGRQSAPASGADSVAGISAASIAVLPFLNMSDDASNEYFSEGLSEELLNLLARIPELRVAARTSSFSYKGKDTKIAQIGEELGVAHVLEGSVRKSGNQIRITAQLVKTDNGFRVWSSTYSRTLSDIFATQDEIAAAVVRGLKVTLLGELPEQRPTDPAVYALYLQGNYFSKLGGKENSQRAMQVLKQALAIDPEYAPAWLSLYYSYTKLQFYGGLPLDEGIALAMQALDKALEIDDQLAGAWAGMAWMKRTVFWDWQGARVALEKALQLEPNNAMVIGSAASIASTFGEHDKAIELFERSVESDPLSLSTLTALGNRYLAVGRHVEARTLYERVLALNPEYPGTGAKIAGTYLYGGRPEEALAKLNGLPDDANFRQIKAAALFDMGETQKAQTALDNVLESPSKDGPLSVALLYAWRGENDEAFEWLEMAFEQRIPSLSYILMNPVLARLKDDPRYPIFLEKMGLREAWEAMPPEYGGPSN